MPFSVEVENFAFFQHVFIYLFRHRFGESYTILHFCAIVRMMLQTQGIVYTINNSTLPLENKLNENILHAINHALQFNDGIES